jgi:hypothetical protein
LSPLINESLSFFNPQITPQRNRLRPDEIGFAFHWAGISLDKHFTGQAPVKWSSNFTGQADYTDTNESSVKIAKSAGFNSPQLVALG